MKSPSCRTLSDSSWTDGCLSQVHEFISGLLKLRLSCFTLSVSRSIVKAMYSFIDAHAHLHDRAYDADREDVLSRMRGSKVVAITVGTDLVQSEKAVLLAEKEKGIWATVGRHPVDNRNEIFDAVKYKELAGREKVVAIGECGLDYYWPSEDNLDLVKEKPRQEEIFRAQIEIAKVVNKPLMLHVRPSRGSQDAYKDTLRILREYPGIRGNVHFFAGDEFVAKEFTDLGFTLSFTGVITFTKDYDSVISCIPAGSILTETDAPYVTPAPLRGKRNEPGNVVFVADRLAALKNMKLEDFMEVVRENAVRVFGITAV